MIDLPLPKTTARHWRLPNGLDIIIQEDHSAPVASLQAWCGVGSIHEDHWLGAGLSHILEHMLFKGTDKRPGTEIAACVQDVGGYINAYTSFDRTVYWIDTPSSGTDVCLDLLMDVVMNATLPESEYEKEQEVIRREFAMGFDDPDRMSSQLLFGTAFQRHPYGNPVIGHMEIFDRLSREDVLAYYHRHYVPNNMLMVVVGDVDAEAIHQTISGFFGQFPRKAYQPVYIPREPTQMGRRDLHLEFETQLSKMHLAWHIPDMTHRDMPALDILAAIMGEGRSSRLYREIREKRQLAHSIGAYSYTPSHGGLFAISATTDADKRETTEEAAIEQVEQIKAVGVSEAELEKARKSCLVDMLDDLTSMRGQANDLAANWMQTRNLDFSRHYLASVRSVTAEEVRAVAQRYLHDRGLTSVSLNPKGTLQQKAKSARAKNKAETVRLKLANGLTLLARRDDRVPLVFGRMSFLAGLLSETAEKAGLTKMTARGLLKGTKSRSASQIAEAMENVGGGISSAGGNNSYALAWNHLTEDLALGLDLASELILAPTFPAPEVEREKAVQIANIKAEQDHLVSLAVRRLRAHLFAGQAYAQSAEGTEESIGRLVPGDLADYHARHALTGNAVLSLYGDIDIDGAARLAEERFSQLALGELTHQPSIQPSAAPHSGLLNIGTDKAQAVLVIGYPGASVASPDRLALELVEEACSDMASRLFLRIREEMGLAYYVSASQMFGLQPGAFYFYLGTDPAQLDEVQAALEDEVAKLAADGLTDRELARAKKTYLGKMAIEKQSLGSVAMLESLDELYGFGFNRSDQLESEIAAIGLDEISRITAKYFGAVKPTIARVAPGLG